MNTNILTEKYPEILEFSSNISENTTIFSEIDIDIKCKSCNEKYLISVKNILKKPFCKNCRLQILQQPISKEFLLEATTDIIKNVKNYTEFCKEVSKYQNRDKGNIQEVFCKIWFETYKKVYDVKKFYSRVLGDDFSEIGLEMKDLGTDCAILHNNNKISFVQCKFRTDKNTALTRESISGMCLEAITKFEKLQFLYLFSNTYDFPKNITESEREKIRSILNFDICCKDWEDLKNYQENSTVNYIKKFQPREWQKNARIAYIESIERGETNFTTVAPCGSGKTYHGHRIINIQKDKKLVYKKTLIVCPTLHLLNQWFENLCIFEPSRNYILVGSDISVDENNRIYDEEKQVNIPYVLTTSKKQISKLIKRYRDNFTIISTYQSLDIVVDSLNSVNMELDETIFDEAHVTCTLNRNSNFYLPLIDDFPTSRKHFITATPKICRGADDMVDMDDEAVYGKRFTYQFNDAIKDDIISDYKICIGHAEINENTTTMLSARFLCQSIKKYSINSVLVCSNRHSLSKDLYDRVEELRQEYGIEHELVFMKNGSTNEDKVKVINKLNTGKPIIIFNVRVFSLGSDMPRLQSVMLNGDKKSIIDIVQTVCRCLRKHPSKEHGWLLIPCLIDRTDEFTQDGSFMNVRKIIASLGSIDSTLKETVIHKTSIPGKIVIDRIIKSAGLQIEKQQEIFDKEFEIDLYNRFCKHSEFSPSYRFTFLLEYCKEKGVLPKKKEIYKGIKINSFLHALLCGIAYLQYRDGWLKQLKDINEDIKKEIEKRLNIKQENKGKEKITPEQRFQILLEYCKEKGVLPTKKEIYKGDKIGSFLINLLIGKDHKQYRDGWLKQLKDINENIKKAIEERINNRNKIKSKSSTSSESSEQTCHYKFTKGENQGKNCTVKPKDGIYCSKHKKYEGKEYITFSESSRTSSTSSTKSLNYKKKDNNIINNSSLTIPQLKQRCDELKITYRSKDVKTILLQKIQDHSRETLFEYCNTEDESKYNLPEEDVEYKGVEIGQVLKDILENSEINSDFIERLKSINPRIKRQIEERI